MIAWVFKDWARAEWHLLDSYCLVIDPPTQVNSSGKRREYVPVGSTAASPPPTFPPEITRIRLDMCHLARARLSGEVCGVLVVIMLLLMQMACTPAGYQKKTTDEVSERATTLAMASQTWQQSSGSALPAVEDLVRQADAQIAIRNLDLASEKLERALRISPDYAPAWSRMAHIALNEADPARAIQMAKRSNSHAGNVVELKLLNWRYIRKASQMLGDTDGVLNAEKSIKILKSL